MTSSRRCAVYPYWLTDPDWQAIATGVAGLAAVIGAYRLGSRQNTLLGHQARIEARKLRAELFDRRLTTYDVATRYVLMMVNWAAGGDEDGKLTREFLVSYRESQFLFGASVYYELTLIFNRSNEIRVLKARLEQLDANDSGRADLIREMGSIVHEQSIRLGRMPEIFQPELDISTLADPL